MNKTMGKPHDASAWYRHLDFALLGCIAAISAIGSLMVYSSTRGPGGNEPYDASFLKKQVVFVAVGGAVMLATMVVDYRRFRDLAPLAYLGCIALLVLVVSPFGSERKGAQAWFQLGSFQLQPSELTKVALILGLAALLSQFQEEIDLRRLGVALVIAGLPLGLILLQPDLGTALVLVAIGAGLLAVGGVRPRHLAALTLAVIFAATAVLSTDVLEQYQRDRLTVFLDAGGASARGEAYNLNQSQIAIGAGGSFGQGLFQGTQTRLRNVPEQHTDFIFTAVGEELGFAGAGTLLALFAIVAWRVWRTAQLARDDFGMYVCIGVLSMLVFQIFQNVGMTMGIMPITGIPLPLVSYGGSATIATYVALGLVLNVHSRRFS